MEQEEGVDELNLADDIALVQPPDLSLSDCMHRLIALDCSRRAFRRAESQAGGDAFLDGSFAGPPLRNRKLLISSYHLLCLQTGIASTPKEDPDGDKEREDDFEHEVHF